MATETADAADAEGQGQETDETPELLFGQPVVEAFGQRVVHVDLDGYVELIENLKDAGYAQVIDLCAVDYLLHDRVDVPKSIAQKRFEVVIQLLSYADRSRLRVRLQVAEGEPVPTLFDLFPGTEAMEREAFDMFGIEFSNHPDLSRILMPETWDGHPLRKDYDTGRIPVQFKGAPSRP